MAEQDLSLELPEAALGDFSRRLEGVRQNADAISRSLRGGLRDAVAEGGRLDAIFRNIAQRLSANVLSRALAPLEKGISNLISGTVGALAGRLGGVTSGARVTPFAKGGVIAAPGFFPLAQGGLGLAGEAGAEAILPLARGADGRLGVSAGGSQAEGSPIVFNISTPDAESFMRSQAQIATMVARAVGRGRRGL